MNDWKAIVLLLAVSITIQRQLGFPFRMLCPALVPLREQEALIEEHCPTTGKYMWYGLAVCLELAAWGWVIIKLVEV